MSKVKSKNGSLFLHKDWGIWALFFFYKKPLTREIILSLM